MRRLLLILTFGALCSCHVGVSYESAPTPTQPFWDPEVFETAVRALEAECPLNEPALVAVLAIPGAYWGLTWWDEDQGLYVIQVEIRQPLHAIIATLEHEWAHAMVWDASEGPEYASHGPLWGVAQARCYRVVLAALTALGEAQAAEEGGGEVPWGKVGRGTR